MYVYTAIPKSTMKCAGVVFLRSTPRDNHPALSIIRELNQRRRRRQRECTFLYISFPSPRDNTTRDGLISRFVGDANTRQRLSFSFPELRYRLLEFSYKEKKCQHLTSWPRWTKRDWLWSSANSLFKSSFRSHLRHRLRCLSSPIFFCVQCGIRSFRPKIVTIRQTTFLRHFVYSGARCISQEKKRNMREKAITTLVGQWLFPRKTWHKISQSQGRAKIIQIVGQFSAILATESKFNYKNISDKYVHRNIECCESTSKSI